MRSHHARSRDCRTRITQTAISNGVAPEIRPVTLVTDALNNRVRPAQRWATGLPALANTVNRTVPTMGVRRTLSALKVINQPGGFDCPGCAWPESAPGERHRIEFCESGAKAVAEEGTSARVDEGFFARHSIADLGERSDFWLGQAGRLTSPMIKRPGGSHYDPITWTGAFAEIARQLLVVGQNPGSNHPRMLTTLELAKRGGATIIAINPLPEAGLIRYKNPQTARGLAGRGTEIADIHLPVRLGGDHALFQLWNHRLLASAEPRSADGLGVK